MRKKNPALYGDIERVIRNYGKQFGVCPSVREIGREVGLSPASVTRYLQQMKEDGLLTYSGHRQIRLLNSEDGPEQFVRVPVVGSVSCGLPKLAEESIEEYVSLPSSLFGSGDYYLLRANGDSMINAGIDDGDLVLIEKTSAALPNQIVCALVGEEATLKRLKNKGGRIILHPENENYQDLELTDGIIQGVARMIIKNLA